VLALPAAVDSEALSGEKKVGVKISFSSGGFSSSQIRRWNVFRSDGGPGAWRRSAGEGCLKGWMALSGPVVAVRLVVSRHVGAG
jgi:hypothetical protein